MPRGPTEVGLAGTGNSTAVAGGVMRPTTSLSWSVYQRLPSGPAAMSHLLPPVLTPAPFEKSVTFPAGVTRPTRLPAVSVNHTLPSEPAAIPSGPLLATGSGNSVTAIASARSAPAATTAQSARAVATPRVPRRCTEAPSDTERSTRPGPGQPP